MSEQVATVQRHPSTYPVESRGTQSRTSRVGRETDGSFEAELQGPRAVGDGREVVASTLDTLINAELELDRLIAVVGSGRQLAPSDLIRIQGSVYRSMQQLELATRCLDRGVSAWKQLAGGQA